MILSLTFKICSVTLNLSVHKSSFTSYFMLNTMFLAICKIFDKTLRFESEKTRFGKKVLRTLKPTATTNHSKYTVLEEHTSQ